ncbi:hypothetical protein ACFXDH_26295 [Streptomyces sp. NPDC059467]|uniref:TetR/AcrR family transcriptional regulator n=1 Tax=Streptomyces sp. NPDC059467 TaxID=3346844 RepID=UPI0036B21B0C
MPAPPCGAWGGGAPPPPHALLRAELLVALGVGVAVVRSAVGLQPLADATPDDLLGPLRDIVDGLLGPPSG